MTVVEGFLYGIGHVNRADPTVIYWAPMFGHIISFVVFTGFPIDLKSVFLHFILQPMEAHIPTFGFTLFNSVIDKSSRC